MRGLSTHLGDVGGVDREVSSDATEGKGGDDSEGNDCGEHFGELLDFYKEREGREGALKARGGWEGEGRVRQQTAVVVAMKKRRRPNSVHCERP